MNQEMIKEVVGYLTVIYGEYLKGIILYGSVARNTATDESDIDIAVLVDADDLRQFEDSLLDVIVDMNLKYDKVFSILDISYNKFKKWEEVMPFYRNVKKDGIVLWEAA